MTKNYFNLEGLKQREEIEMKLTRKTTVPHKNIEGKPMKPDIEERITMPQSNMDSKVFVLEKLRFANGTVELRFGYWIIGKHGRMKDKWSWGQFAPFIPPDDFEKLIQKTREKGFI